ncbi:hypothetical protein GCM10023183_14520 [Nibribacter koreensis]|uniref:DUF4173 domain-containing protein n=2 Tax=Nibribacter koreensis TaxID=1084519 RepID=A0ABP8FFK9_9BACT
MALKNELKTGVLLLALLNGLLFVFILSDAYYLFIGDLPEGIPYSEYLHQGVYTLIFTILLAIAILLYLFRENLNFYSKNQSLKKLAYVWLGLNMVLVLLTLTKNSIYITGTGLTYKRIGVYTYLILTGIGLIFSYIKVSKVKTNWYLFRMNGWAVYVLLVVFSTVNWDRVLTRFNLTYAKSPDLAYLFTLSNSNLSLLKEDIALSRHAFTDNQKKSLAEWELEYLRGEAQKEWQSWNYNDWRLSNELR